MHLDLSPKPEKPLSETHEPIRTIGLEVHFAIMTPAGAPANIHSLVEILAELVDI